jgi:hypothetical protein
MTHSNNKSGRTHTMAPDPLGSARATESVRHPRMHFLQEHIAAIGVIRTTPCASVSVATLIRPSSSKVARRYRRKVDTSVRPTRLTRLIRAFWGIGG